MVVSKEHSPQIQSIEVIINLSLLLDVDMYLFITIVTNQKAYTASTNWSTTKRRRHELVLAKSPMVEPDGAGKVNASAYRGQEKTSLLGFRSALLIT